MLGGMQFGVLVTAGCCGACSLGPGARGHVVWGAGGGAALRDWRPGAGGMQFGVLVDASLTAGCQLGLLVEVPGGCSLGCLCSRGAWWCWCWCRCCSGVLFEVLVKG